MKITIEVGQDAELRKQILEIVANQVKKVAGEEIKELVKSHLQQINIASKVASSIKDLVNRQIDMAIRGYGSIVVQQLMDSRMKEWSSDGKEKIRENIERHLGKLVRETVSTKFFNTMKEIVNNKANEE